MLTIDKTILSKVLDDLAKVTSHKTTIPVLTCVAFERFNGGLKVSANNLRIRRELIIEEVEGELDFDFCISNDILSQFVRSGEDEIHFEFNKPAQVCRLNSKNSELLIPYLPIEMFRNYIVPPEGRNVIEFYIDSGVLTDSVLNTHYAVSNKENDLLLGSLYFCKERDTLNVYSTNRKRINRFSSRGLNLMNEDKFAFNVSAADSLALVDFLSWYVGENVTLEVFEKTLVVKAKNGGYFQVKLVDIDGYPDCKSFLPDFKKGYNKMVVDKEGFARLIKKILILYHKELSKVVFSLEKHWLRVKVIHTALGSLSDCIPVFENNKIGAVYMGLNPYYLMDVLKRHNDKIVELYFKDNYSPIVIEARKEQCNLTSLIMPMRTE